MMYDPYRPFWVRQAEEDRIAIEAIQRSTLTWKNLEDLCWMVALAV